MTTFEIRYIRTGTGEVNIADQNWIRKHTDRVWIHTGDERKDGTKVHNIMDAIEYFEELAEGWGTYETKHAIINIKVTER